MGDDFIPLMRVIDGEGFVYWMEGHERQDAVDSFGEDILITMFYAVDTNQITDNQT